MPLKILFIGDVVGSPGRKIVGQVLPRLILRWDIGLVVCNAENAAGGSGLTIKCYEDLVEAGVDVFTLGDHVYRKDEVFVLFERTDRLLRPANFPTDSPGAEAVLVEAKDGTTVGVFTVLGRTYMRPVDCPFRAADRVLERIGPNAKVIVVDVHAEATSDKQLLGRYLDGRVSAVLGTHTHVATADEQILPRGTAYQTDVGMTGPHDSILGRRVRPRPGRDADASSPITSTSPRATLASMVLWSRSIPRPAVPGRSAASRSARGRPSGS